MKPDAPSDLREPPWSSEAEHAVLAGLMFDPDAMVRIADMGLEAGHFFAQESRDIFAAAQRLAARSKPVDELTVHEELTAAGVAIPLKRVFEISNSVPSAANIRQYADIVLEKALRRAVMSAADNAITVALEPGDAAEKLDKAMALFAAIKHTSVRAEPKSLRDVLALRLGYYEDMANGDVTPGISTGLEGVDQILGGGLKPGKVLIIAARPSVGKSSLAQQIGLNAAAGGSNVLMLSQEMPAGEVADRAVSNLGRIVLDRINTGGFRDDDWTRVCEAAEAMNKLPFWVDDQPALTLLDIRAKAHMVKHKHGLDVLIIDYIQLCASTGGSDRRHHQIEEISRGLKRLAKELDVAILLLSQLNRNADDREPRLSDLKESGSIEEDADVVAFLHPRGKQPDGSLLLALIFAKNRQGKRARVALSFNGPTQRWESSCADVSPKREAS